MAAFAHILISMLLGLLLMKFTEGKFTVRHTLIFAVNSYFGPDLFGWMPYYGEGSEIYYFIHGYGWILVALIVAIPWWIVTKFQFSWDERKISMRPAGDSLIMTFVAVYCLVAAGGIFHQFIDLISHPPYVNIDGYGIVPWGAVWFGGDNWFSMQTMLGTGMFPCGNLLEFDQMYIFIGIVAPIIGIVGIFGIPRKNGKYFPQLLTVLLLVYFVPLIIAYFVPDPNSIALTDPRANYFGDMSEGAHYPSSFYLTGGESDLGVFIYMLLFFFVPMTLLYWSYHGIPFKMIKKGQEEGFVEKATEKNLNSEQKS